MPRLVGSMSRGCAYIMVARLLGVSASTEAAWRQVAEAAKAQGYCNKAYDRSQITQAPNDNPRQWVEAHNHYRSCHGSPAVIWDPTLASHAKAWAEVVAAHCDGVVDVGNFVKSSGREPHDPESYDQRPSNAENIAVFESPGMNIIEFDERTTVEGWYREVESQCPDMGLSPGCGDTINHYAAVVWKQNYKIGCYSAVRGNFKVVSCRYASAAKTGVGDQGCDNAGGGAKCASEGPPEPQVPALVKGTSCPRLGGLPGLQHGPGPGLKLPSGGKMAPIGTVLWSWLRQKLGGGRGQSSEDAPPAADPPLAARFRQAVYQTAQFWRSAPGRLWGAMHPAQPRRVHHLEAVHKTIQFWRSAAGNVRSSLRSRLHLAQPQQVAQPPPPVAQLYDTRGLRASAHSSGVPLFVALPVGLAGLLAGAAAIAVRVAHAMPPTEPEHGDSDALLDPGQPDVE